jgi:hypothetical protein
LLGIHPNLHPNKKEGKVSISNHVNLSFFTCAFSKTTATSTFPTIRLEVNVIAIKAPSPSLDRETIKSGTFSLLPRPLTALPYIAFAPPTVTVVPDQPTKYLHPPSHSDGSPSYHLHETHLKTLRTPDSSNTSQNACYCRRTQGPGQTAPGIQPTPHNHQTLR